ncbi:MAG TPA: type II toxin-antitoxin system death-on-curing family toxin [Baekduia sp.]|nr:type II toxin-antitoxin system death-on-curing family toxin [Baekduia sp.]
MRRIEIEDLIVIAELVLGIPAEHLRNHPFIDGNKRVSLVTMIEFLRRNGEPWPDHLDQDEVADVFERVAARALSEEAFAAWIAAKLAQSS